MRTETVVVTGGSSGIGAAIVAVLIAEGTEVINIDLVPPPNQPEHMHYIQCDLSLPQAIEKVCGQISNQWPHVNGLINSAGVAFGKETLTFTAEDFESTLRLNVTAPYLLTVGLAERLRVNHGKIVNVASTAAFYPNPFLVPYAASKAAVLSLTKSLAAGLGPDITVNAVCPGIIDTPMWEALDTQFRSIESDMSFAKRSSQAPLKRAGTAEEVAHAVAFLISDKSSYITGAHLTISGGLVMQ